MSLGSGTIYAALVKQKLNTVNTTDSELVGVADAIPKMVWPWLFMEAQGYNVEDIYIYQDNKNPILLENNGIKSVGKNSRHIMLDYDIIVVIYS